MAAVIFNGEKVRALKRQLQLNDKAKIMSDSVDPSAVAVDANAGDIFISTSTNKLYQKLDNGLSTNWEVLNLSVSDTNSLDLTLTGGILSADIILSPAAADGGNTIVALDVQPDGVRAQMLHASFTNEGSVNIVAQTFNGEKTFTETIYGSKHLILGSATIDPAASRNLVLGDADLQPGAVQVLSVGTTHTVNGDQSIVFGSNNALVSGSNNIVGGDNNSNTGNFNTVVGQNHIIAGDYALVGGFSHDVTGSYGTALGNNNTVSGTGAAALGHLTNATGNYSLSQGSGSQASGLYSAAFNDNTTASGQSSFSQGESTVASGNDSAAFGLGSIANSDQQFAVGQYSESTGAPSSPTSTDRLFVVGYGADSLNRADAFFVQRDGISSFAENVILNGTPSSSLHAVNKQYVDSYAQGVKWKQSVRAATTADITLSGEQTIDTVAVVTGERVLVKDQLTASENGIYIVDSGAWTRALDVDSGTELDSAAVSVEEGGNAGRGYLQIAQNVNIGVDSVTFYQIFGPGAYTADGQGIELSGTVFSLELDGSTLSKSASGLKVSTGGITNTEVNASAGIVYSKLSLSNSIVNVDVNASAAIAYSKLNLSNSIVNADINASAAIDASKIADGSVSSTEFQYINSLTSNAQTQLDNKVDKVTGDIAPTSFSLANNQAVAADVTGLAFANGVVRGAEVFYTIFIDATSQLYESGTLRLIQRASDWQMSQDATGDNSQIVFSVTTSGQIQYTSANYSGFVSATMKFRAITLGV